MITSLPAPKSTGEYFNINWLRMRSPITSLLVQSCKAKNNNLAPKDVQPYFRTSTIAQEIVKHLPKTMKAQKAKL